MKLAQINLQTVRSLYNNSDTDVSHELAAFAREHSAHLWEAAETGETVLSFADGSQIVMHGSQCDTRDVIAFSSGAQACIEETNADWRGDLQSLRSGQLGLDQLRDHCLNGVEDLARTCGWHDYVDALEAAL